LVSRYLLDTTPKTAVVPVRILESWERERQALFDTMRAASERANLSEEEAEQLVADAIERVRSRG
jgi:hypothetical protein